MSKTVAGNDPLAAEAVGCCDGGCKTSASFEVTASPCVEAAPGHRLLTEHLLRLQRCVAESSIRTMHLFADEVSLCNSERLQMVQLLRFGGGIQSASSCVEQPGEVEVGQWGRDLGTRAATHLAASEALPRPRGDALCEADTVDADGKPTEMDVGAPITIPAEVELPHGRVAPSAVSSPGMGQRHRRDDGESPLLFEGFSDGHAVCRPKPWLVTAGDDSPTDSVGLAFGNGVHGASKAEQSGPVKRLARSNALLARNSVPGSDSRRSTFRSSFMFSARGEEESPSHANVKTRKSAQLNMFADPDMLKAQVRRAMEVKEYSVCDFYHTTGYIQMIGRSVEFENVTMMMIVLNSIWLAIDLDTNPANSVTGSPLVYQYTEHCFSSYFTAELLIRFLCFRLKSLCLTDFWFVFDTVLWFLTVLDSWIVPVFNLFVPLEASRTSSVFRLLRLVRIIRVARIARLLRRVPETVILIKGMGLAARSVFFTLVLLFILIYTFAVTFKAFTDTTPVGQEYFRTVPVAMLTLLLQGTLPDFSKIVYDLGDAQVLYGFMALVFIFLATLMLLNMLIGVVVEAVSAVAEVEKEKMSATMVRTKLQWILKQRDDIDLADDEVLSTISKSQFHKLLTQETVAAVFREMKVDVMSLLDAAEVLFQKDGSDSMSFGSLMEAVMELRGNQNATVKDIVGLRNWFTQEIQIILDAVERFQRSSQATQRKVPLRARCMNDAFALEMASGTSGLSQQMMTNGREVVGRRESASKIPVEPALLVAAQDAVSAVAQLRQISGHSPGSGDTQRGENFDTVNSWVAEPLDLAAARQRIITAIQRASLRGCPVGTRGANESQNGVETDELEFDRPADLQASGISILEADGEEVCAL